MVHLMENHDEALYVWAEQGVTKRPVVHVDAHADYFPARLVDVGSYLYHAREQGLMESFYWVLPEPTCRRPVLFDRAVGQLVRQGLTVSHSETSPRVVIGNLNGMLTWVGPVDALPVLQQPVLLDIDVDYFTTPFISDRQHGEGLVPWQTPDQLLDSLSRRVQWDTVTVSASVAGGYTPAQWRCVAPLCGDVFDGRRPLFDWSEAKRGARTHRSGRKHEAKDIFSGLANPHSHTYQQSAAHIWLARIHAELGACQEARHHLLKARALDPGYDTYWSCPGFGHLLFGSSRVAARHFRMWERILVDEPMLYAAWALAVWRTDGHRALQYARRALELAPNLADAHFCLGRLLFRSGQAAQGISHLEKALQLGRAGVTSFLDPIRSRPEAGTVNASAMLRVMKELVLAYAQAGRPKDAKRYFSFLDSKHLLSPRDRLNLLRSAPGLSESPLGLDRLRMLWEWGWTTARSHAHDRTVGLKNALEDCLLQLQYR